VKTLLCPCEDITVAEVEDTVRAGYASLEDVKRFTGLATGSCQGRLCVLATLNVLTRLTGREPTEHGLITFRPPLDPVPLGLLAAGAPEPKEAHL
jgi:bacterioferritin-associated ferredoxin